MTRTIAPGIHIQVVPSAKFGAAAADLVASALRNKPDAVIGFPTGNTPLPMYHELLHRQRRATIDLSHLDAVMLDDYLGVSADDPISFYGWLSREFFTPAGIQGDRLLRIPTDPQAIETACAAYEKGLAERGGVDLQLLGLGLNGHIGFNEPGTSPDSRTHVVRLTPTTTAANAAYWDDASRIPENGVTMGIGTILEARSIGLLVNGENKAEILRRTLLGPIDAQVPASFLRRAPHVQIVADEAAASLLS